ncbi:arginine--tRNA ligase, partial [Dehalococcoidia bacterium]|nr:arginine--tRNA ligase [Dehalococcoidia bacterium]
MFRIREMLKEKIAGLLEQSVIRAQEEELIPSVALPDILVEHPQKPEHGDFATTIALKLGRAAKARPLSIAEALVKLLPPMEEIERVRVAPPGFINFKVREDWLRQQVDEILSQGDHYGDSGSGRGCRVQVEFVSVNPTGPLHVGHGRGAVLGSTLANVLSAAGYSVEREYYINDAGNQMENFYTSLYARYREVFGLPAQIPAEGYHGAYVIEIARRIAAERGDVFLESKEGMREIGRIGSEMII